MLTDQKLMDAMIEYDHSIHMNPDAKAWAEFFMKTKEENKWSLEDIDKELMIGWFANAMMAMHDHLHHEKIEQLQRQNDELVEENQQLKTRISRLLTKGQELATLQEEGEYYHRCEVANEWDEMAGELPQQSLAEIQADAIEKAVEELKPFAFYMHGRGNMICEHSLRNYAKQLRQQSNRSNRE